MIVGDQEFADHSQWITKSRLEGIGRYGYMKSSSVVSNPAIRRSVF